jgi:DNA-directed RNA polymerase subunit RPC12/RpoP
MLGCTIDELVSGEDANVNAGTIIRCPQCGHEIKIKVEQ